METENDKHLVVSERIHQDLKALALSEKKTVFELTEEILGKYLAKKKKRELLPTDDIAEVIHLFKDVNPSHQRLFGRTNQRQAVERLLVQYPRPQLDNIIRVLGQTNQDKYAPTITTPLELEERMGKLIAFIQKQRINRKGKEILGL